MKPGKKPGSAKTGGRQKGAPNKKTVELLELWQTLKYDPAKALLEILPGLDDDKQADVHLKLMEYKYPKRKAVELSGPDDGDIPTNNSEALELVREFNEAIQEYERERSKK